MLKIEYVAPPPWYLDCGLTMVIFAGASTGIFIVAKDGKDRDRKIVVLCGGLIPATKNPVDVGFPIPVGQMNMILKSNFRGKQGIIWVWGEEPFAEIHVQAVL